VTDVTHKIETRSHGHITDFSHFHPEGKLSFSSGLRDIIATRNSTVLQKSRVLSQMLSTYCPESRILETAIRRVKGVSRPGRSRIEIIKWRQT